MNFFMLYQLPIFPPEAYVPWQLDGKPLDGFLSKAAMRLTCSSDALTPLAAEAGLSPPVQAWDEGGRFAQMRQIDAIYARMYGLTRDEFSHVLETFPITRETETQRFGRFRTKEDSLKAFDELEGRLSSIEGKA